MFILISKNEWLQCLFLPNALDIHVALSGDMFPQQNGLTKSSSITAANALRPEDIVLKYWHTENKNTWDSS